MGKPAFYLLLLMLCGCISAEKATFAPSERGVQSDETLLSVGIEPVTLKTSDGEDLHALFIPNSESDILTIYFHGNGGNVHARIRALYKLKTLGTSVLAISYRGYLNSSGEPTEAGVYLDAQSALDYAQNTLGFLEKEIVVFGRSLGSAIAIDLAQNRELKGLILVTPFINSRELFNSLPRKLRFLIRNKNKFIDTSFRNEKKVLALRTKTLVVHGTKDSLIPFEHGKTLYDLLPVEKFSLWLDGADHNDFGYNVYNDHEIAYWKAIENMLQ